ncbi:MFS transporter [Marinobacterium weihaiense]|uniref:MFS transporter n=1 Tax=Marinobacterium weihaiense TaxID=2851016 RepID=A0ABS6M6J8_9GAMM|nr:MFS transporter [Marinobacterium weihaiense]MBV0931855.1 MFS transporter [Marinobacterium weihaiense]
MSRSSLTENLYAKLMNEEDARACKAIDDDACQAVPGNFLRQLCSQFLTKLGDAIANPKIVLPWVLEALGAPLYLLGLLVPIRESGSLIPQLVIASHVRRQNVRKWSWVLGSVIQGVTIMLMGLAAWQLSGLTAGWVLVGLLVVFSLARGLCSVAAKDVTGKTIPKQRRGKLNGWSASLAGLVTLAGGVILVTGQGWLQTPPEYAILLVAAGLIWLLAALLYAGVKEYPGATEGGVNALSEALKRLGILRTDAAFRRFVIARALFLCSALTAPYYVVLAQQQSDGSSGLLGLFLLSSGAASLISGPVWGHFADLSSRQVMACSGLLAALLGVGLWLLDWLNPAWLELVWLLPLAYFVLSIAHQGVRIGRKTYVTDLAEGNRRTDYVALSNTLIGVVLLLAGSLGALTSVVELIDIVLLMSFMGLAGVWLARGLPEVSD